jgi:hypothetical protein
LDEYQTFVELSAIVHPKFNEETFEYDFMVLQLDTPVIGAQPVR